MHFLLVPPLTKLALNWDWASAGRSVWWLPYICQIIIIIGNTKMVCIIGLSINLLSSTFLFGIFFTRLHMGYQQTIVLITMQGGLFGLNKVQQAYLYICQIIPTVIALYEADLIFTMLFVEVFYLLSSWFYVKFISIQKSWYPYVINELVKLKFQLHKGFVLGISAFLLITVYGVIFIKIGRVALPSQIHLGESFNHYWWVFAFLSFLNPFIEEWFWRLFLPKTFDSTYYKSHMMNISYLLFHFVLFSRYVGFFRAVPLVGTFFSVGRSMSHIKSKYGILSSVVTHYGITLGSFTLYIYLKLTTQIFK